MRSAKRLLWSEADLVASPSAPARVRAQARGWFAFTLDEPGDRRCRSRSSPHRDPQRPCQQDLSQSWNPRTGFELILLSNVIELSRLADTFERPGRCQM